jgi:hypothetical protein
MYTRSILCAVVLMIFLAGSDAISFTIDSAGVNSTSIIRSQLQSIADEVVDSAKFDVKGRVAVLVEGEGLRTLAENAFIEALQKRNYTSVVIDTASINQIFHLFIFNAEIKVRELNAKLSERNIRTSLEARVAQGAERQVRMLGTFHRVTKDTAQVFTSGLIPAVQKNDESGILQRMLTPFIVVGGAIVIVYLFFTVRS